MPHYYFNVAERETVLDESGQHMIDLGAARREAMIAAGQMLTDYQPVWDGTKWEMWVTDEPNGKGNTLLRLVFCASGDA